MKAKAFVVAAISIAIGGCAASVKFIDRQTGDAYLGKTVGSTLGGDGSITAEIDGDTYTGTWIYSQSGGGYTLGTTTATSVGPAGTMTTTGTSTGIVSSAQGNGMIHMKSAAGRSVRCVFQFNSMSNKGIGECQRNDGRLFDVTIKR